LLKKGSQVRTAKEWGQQSREEVQQRWESTWSPTGARSHGELLSMNGTTVLAAFYLLSRAREAV